MRQIRGTGNNRQLHVRPIMENGSVGAFAWYLAPTMIEVYGNARIHFQPFADEYQYGTKYNLIVLLKKQDRYGRLYKLPIGVAQSGESQ
jgi:hypothetical protein